MGSRTGIEWTDATWNPVTGCTKVSAGCKFCYAERDFHRPYPGRDFTDVRCHPERLDWPVRWRGSKQAKAEGRPSRIFVNSMSDLFHHEVNSTFIFDCFYAMRRAGNNFQILTKRPGRMLDLCNFMDRHLQPWPLPNVWLGVSVEDQETADERIPWLLQAPAAVRFVSYEPALGPVDIERFLHRCHADRDGDCRHGGCPQLRDDSGHCKIDTWPDDEEAEPQGLLDWVIAGGESGSHARPSHPDWFRNVRDQCQAAGVPFFFKQWGGWAPNCLCDTARPHRTTPRPSPGLVGCMFRCGRKNSGRLLDGREWNEFPEGK